MLSVRSGNRWTIVDWSSAGRQYGMSLGLVEYCPEKQSAESAADLIVMLLTQPVYERQI